MTEGYVRQSRTSIAFAALWRVNDVNVPHGYEGREEMILTDEDHMEAKITIRKKSDGTLFLDLSDTEIEEKACFSDTTDPAWFGYTVARAGETTGKYQAVIEVNATVDGIRVYDEILIEFELTDDRVAAAS